MQLDEFHRLLHPYLDGELDEEQRQRFTDFVNASQDARQTVEFQLELKRSARRSLTAPISSDRRERLMSSFRREAATIAAAEPPQVASRQPAHRRTFAAKRFSMIAIPAAAAAALLGLWLGGVFGNSPIEHSHSPILEGVWYAGDDFFKQVGVTDKHPKVIIDRLETLARLEQFRYFSDSENLPRQDRLEVCRSLIKEVLNLDVPIEELLVDDCVVMAAQAKVLVLHDGEKVQSVHLIYESPAGEISAFVIPESHGAAAKATMHGPKGDREKEIGLHQCPDCQIATLALGPTMVVVVTRMPFDLFQQKILKQ